jgi:hypothetical protein
MEFHHPAQFDRETDLALSRFQFQSREIAAEILNSHFDFLMQAGSPTFKSRRG